MKKISVWAKYNVFAARCVIVFSFVLLTVAGIITGILLDELAVVIPSAAGTLFIVLYFVGAIFYPFRSDKRKIGADLFYRKQKLADFILAGSTFLIVAFLSNDHFRSIRYFPLLQAAASNMPDIPGDSSITSSSYKSIATFSAFLKDGNGKKLKLKERKKLLHVQIHAIKNATGMSTAGKIALIVLSVILALGLVFLLSALVCSLSCGGVEAGAILLTLGGMVLIAFLLVATIRAIKNNKKKKDPIRNKQEEKT